MEYLRRIASLNELYVEDLLKCSNILTDFLKATEYERSKMQTNLMLLLMKYGSQKKLMREVKNIKKTLKENENKMRSLVEEMEQIRKNKFLKCPHCDGMGGRMTIKITRDDGVATPHIIRITCPICNGTGTLNVSEGLEDYISLFIRILRNVIRTEQTVYQMIKNIVNSSEDSIKTDDRNGF